jgi:type IV secretory pathway VirB3-like protein
MSEHHTRSFLSQAVIYPPEQFGMARVMLQWLVVFLMALWFISYTFWGLWYSLFITVYVGLPALAILRVSWLIDKHLLSIIRNWLRIVGVPVTYLYFKSVSYGVGNRRKIQ